MTHMAVIPSSLVSLCAPASEPPARAPRGMVTGIIAATSAALLAHTTSIRPHHQAGGHEAWDTLLERPVTLLKVSRPRMVQLAAGDRVLIDGLKVEFASIGTATHRSPQDGLSAGQTRVQQANRND